MAKIYYKQILAGKMTLDEVPIRWRESVKEMLSSENQG